MPSSRTVRTARSSPASAVICTQPPAGVYFTALLTRLCTTLSSSSGSPSASDVRSPELDLDLEALLRGGEGGQRDGVADQLAEVDRVQAQRLVGLADLAQQEQVLDHAGHPVARRGRWLPGRRAPPRRC